MAGCASFEQARSLQRATHLNAEAGREGAKGAYQSALPKAREALAIRERALDAADPRVAESLHTLAFLLRRAGDFSSARPLYERALRIREQALGLDHPTVADTLMGFGWLLQEQADFAGARAVYERILKIRVRALGPDHAGVAHTLYDFAILHGRMGDAAGAIAMHERALRMREQALGPHHPLVAQSLSSLGGLLADKTRYAEARLLLERALAITERARGPDHPAVADALMRFAWLLQQQADFAGVRAVYERVLKIRVRALGPDHAAVAHTLHDFAILHGRMGDAAGAIAMHERALRMREQALGPHHPWVAQSLSSLGRLLADKTRYAEARPLLERALGIREQALGPDHRDVADVLDHLGALSRETGDYSRARPLVERALRIREQSLGPSHPAVAGSLSNLASLLRLTGDHASALPLLERALKIREEALGPRHPMFAWSLRNLGRLLTDVDRYAEATQHYERSAEIVEAALGPNHPALAQSLNGLGLIRLKTGDYAAGRPLFERALAIARAAPAPGAHWRAALGLGTIHEGEGRLAEALPLLLEAVKTLEEMAGRFREEDGRSQYLKVGDRLSAYEALTRVRLKLHEREPTQGHDDEAWAVLEAGRGRLVAEILAAARPEPQDPMAREEAQRAQAKQDQIVEIEAELGEEQAKPAPERQPVKVRNLTALLAQSKAEYVAEAKTFLTRYPQYKAQFVDQQTVDPKALAKFADRLPAGTLAVQYFPAPDRLYLFVVAPGGRFQVKAQTVSQEELYGLIREYRRWLERAAEQRLVWADDGSEGYRSEVAPLKEVSRKLATHLLGPIRGELEQHRNLVLIPNGLLHHMPIHALTLDGPGGSGHFLAETHAVSYLTQLELVELLSPSKAGEDARLLALGDPDGTLPEASREVREIAKIRPSATVLEGAEATKSRFLSLAGEFADIHFATHGFLDPDGPERSFILLAGADEASQRLGIGEIAGLRLPLTRLVILSACETALGEQVPGAALITLSAAFSQAGAQSIVGSLWKVEDAAARDFMVAFHRALSTLGRAAALQEAQMALIRSTENAHPFYWAPFILIGAR
jgi:CHAT domain-containing protein/Tfp pilus assembly protein PilF